MSAEKFFQLPPYLLLGHSDDLGQVDHVLRPDLARRVIRAAVVEPDALPHEVLPRTPIEVDFLGDRVSVGNYIWVHVPSVVAP